MGKSYSKTQLLKFTQYINLFNLVLGSVWFYLFYYYNSGNKELGMDLVGFIIWVGATSLSTAKIASSPKNKDKRVESTFFMLSIFISVFLMYMILLQI